MSQYKYGSVVRIVDDDPKNEDITPGTIVGEAGKHEDGGVLYSTIGENGMHDIHAETVEVYDVSNNGARVTEKTAQRRALEKIREDDEHDLDEIRNEEAPADD